MWQASRRKLKNVCGMKGGNTGLTEHLKRSFAHFPHLVCLVKVSKKAGNDFVLMFNM